MRREIGHQLLAIGLPGLGAAERVDLQAQPVEAEASPEPRRHQDLFGIDVRAGQSEGLDAQLMELPIAPLLRPFVAKHRSQIPEAARLVVQESVLDTGPHAAGRAFGAQGETLAVAVLEGVHLLLDDVRDLADRSPEQLGLLDDGHADLGIAIGLHGLAQQRLDRLPGGGLVRQEVVHPPYRLNLSLGHGFPSRMDRFAMPKCGGLYPSHSVDGGGGSGRVASPGTSVSGESAVRACQAATRSGPKR